MGSDHRGVTESTGRERSSTIDVPHAQKHIESSGSAPRIADTRDDTMQHSREVVTGTDARSKPHAPPSAHVKVGPNDRRESSRIETHPTKPAPARIEPPKPITPIAKTEPPKIAPPTPAVTAESAPQKPIAPYVAPASPKAAAPAAPITVSPKAPSAEKKELGAPEIQKIRSVIETGLSNYRGIAAFKTQNRKNERERTLDAVFRAAGETPRAGDRFAAAKRLARLAGADYLNMVEDLHRN